MSFQSTLSHGERRIQQMIFTLITRFQSTLSHGERHCEIFKNTIANYFNPLSRMEKDGSPAFLSSVPVRFQSTLSHGERLILQRKVPLTFSFQSTLSHGERLGSSITVWECNYFNPLSRMEKDCKNPHKIIYLYLIFA